MNILRKGSENDLRNGNMVEFIPYQLRVYMSREKKLKYAIDFSNSQ